MNALIFSIFAAIFAAGANLFFRKSGDASAKKDYNLYLLMLYLTSLIIACLLIPYKGWPEFNPVLFSIGAFVGILNMGMMWMTSKALQRGPSGLTFAFQNASAIFPGILLFGLFGPLFGFSISFIQCVGMGIVLWGLFYGQGKGQWEGWLKFALGSFILQIGTLTVIHWRCLLFNQNIPSHGLIPWNFAECDDAWFLPGQFIVAFLLQLGMVLKEGKREWMGRELIYGLSWGVLNGLNSLCLLVATRIALPYEKGLIFPFFAIFTMILCNSWANRIYRERFNFGSNALCSLGILIASL
jgi:hypothetical protein